MKTRILLKTKDGREFSTYTKNKSAAVAFAKKYKAEVYEVEMIDGASMELDKIAEAFCNPEYQFQGSYKSPKRVFPTKSNSRTSMLKDAKVIREYIEKQMRNGKTLSLQDIKKKYAKKEVTDSCLSNHFSQVRKILSSEGAQIERIKKGVYKIKS